MPQDDEERLELHDLFYGILLEKVRQDRYPSWTMLNILEEHMVGHEREEFVKMLVQRSPRIDTQASRCSSAS